VVTNESILTTSNSKDSLRITRRQVNRRLWVLFGVSLLVAIVYAWFKFVTSLWDPEKAKAWLKTFLYIWVAFAIALFAFIIVRLVTNLFIS
jgi:FtsH-binding integral membrane protein